MSLSQTLCKFLTLTFIIFVELDPQNHQEKSLHNLRRGLFQVLSSTELHCDSVPCVGAIKDNLLILSHLTVTAAAASVEVREMLTPLWRSATTSAQLLSITGTAPSTPLNIPRMPLGSCSLPGPARGTATWVKFPLPYNSFYNFFFLYHLKTSLSERNAMQNLKGPVVPFFWIFLFNPVLQWSSLVLFGKTNNPYMSRKYHISLSYDLRILTPCLNWGSVGLSAMNSRLRLFCHEPVAEVTMNLDMTVTNFQTCVV